MRNSRWSPTPEQLMVLEELYRRGLRTPRASQIQKITAHLSLYGQLQGKNVFYWFQNHKARDRQKLRNKLSNQHQFHHLYPLPFHSHPRPALNCNIIPFQGNGICEEVSVPDVGVRDWLMMRRRYGHDSSMMIVEEEGPSSTTPSCIPAACCRSRSRSKPLQTLDLFPLTSPTAAAAAASNLQQI